MEIKRATIEDIEEIHRILKHPDIWDVITDDGAQQDSFNIAHLLLHPGNFFLLCGENALISAFQTNAITWDLHFNSLSRSDVEAVFEAMDYIFSHSNCLKITAHIASLYTNILKLAITVGYSVEGLIRSCYLKNGRVYDQYVVGITIDKFKEEYGSWIDSRDVS